MRIFYGLNPLYKTQYYIVETARKLQVQIYQNLNKTVFQKKKKVTSSYCLIDGLMLMGN